MIVGVAIKHDKSFYSLPKPNRHSNVIKLMVDIGIQTPIKGEQGFINDKGKFLSREESWVEALNCGQISGEKFGILFSEDLW